MDPGRDRQGEQGKPSDASKQENRPQSTQPSDQNNLEKSDTKAPNDQDGVRTDGSGTNPQNDSRRPGTSSTTRSGQDKRTSQTNNSSEPDKAKEKNATDDSNKQGSDTTITLQREKTSLISIHSTPEQEALLKKKERRRTRWDLPDQGQEEKATTKMGYQRRSVDAVNVVRRVYKVETLNQDAEYRGGVRRPFRRRAKKLMKICGYGTDCLYNSVPIVKWLPKYNVEKYLFSDCVAGATSAVMHIPQGMAYALLAEVPPVVGLYMAFFPILLYVVFGTCPHLSMGTFAVACLMAGKVVAQYSFIGNETLANGTTLVMHEFSTFRNTSGIYTPLEVLGSVCFGVGCFQMLMWAFRLGAVSTLLSEPLVSGFTCAASFHVLASQLKEIFGIKLPKFNGNYKVIFTVIELSKNILSLNYAACIISAITCSLILLNNSLLKPWASTKCRFPIPIELFVIVAGTLSCRYGALADKFNINIVGNIPTGLPMPAVPRFELLPDIAMDCFIITMVTYSITMSMALIFAAREKTDIDPNQELLALGASNIFASFFNCAPFCASISRSYIQYKAGSKTGVTSLVSASIILCVLLWIGPFFEQLPRSVLATMIAVALYSMYTKITDVCKFCRLSTLDGMVWIVTFFTTLVFNIDVGLTAGLLSSIASLFIRFQRPYSCLLGRVGDTDLYVDIKRYRAASEIPGIKIFHYCGGLNFASKNLFRDTLFRKIGYMKPQSGAPPVEDTSDADDPLSRSESYVWDPTISNKVRCVIIDATAMSHVDVPGIKSLVAVQEELVSSQIMVLLAGANAPILEMIEEFNNQKRSPFIVPMFPTVHDAVVYYMLMQKDLQGNLDKDYLPVTNMPEQQEPPK